LILFKIWLKYSIIDLKEKRKRKNAS